MTVAWRGLRARLMPAVGASLPPDTKRLAVAIFFAVAATNLLTPLLPSITSEFRISYSTAGFLVSSYILARLVASVFVGWLAVRLGTIVLASIGVGTLFVGSIVGITSPNVEVLLVSRLLAGGGVGIISTLALSALADLAPTRKRGQVLSLFQIAHNGGIALYPVLGGVMGVLAGWRATFVVMAIGAALCGWFLLPVLRRVRARGDDATDGEPEPDELPVSRTRQRVGIAVVLGGVFATMFNRHGMRNTLLPLYGGAVLGLGPVAIATGVTVMSIIGLVIAMPGAMAGDRLGQRRLIVGGLLALAVGDVVFLATGDYGSFLVASMALGLGDFFIGSQTALLASMAPPGRRTQVLSGFRFATDAGALAGPIVLAALMDTFGPQLAMLAAAAILAIVAIASRVGLPAPDLRLRRRAAA
jgi:DHA1 family chloramphenicol resistance protein-like MFS transporter